MSSTYCPLAHSDRELVRRFLLCLPLHELHHVVQQVHDSLSPAELMGFNINRFCSEYPNVEGRIRFLLALLDASVITLLALPPGSSFNRETRQLTLARSVGIPSG